MRMHEIYHGVKNHKQPQLATILIVGLARDCERTFELDFKRFNNAFSFCSNLSWLIIESDSADNTLKILKKIKMKNENFSYISLGKLQLALPRRTERIAECRNEYLKEIIRNPIYKKIDYIVVADLDDINTLITKAAVLSCWERQDWDACCANQTGPYYDIWALRHQQWSTDDCWEKQKYLQNTGQSKYKSTVNAVINRMINIHPSKNWIEVESAFGGCAIYKKSTLLSGSYSGITSTGGEICEHVTFHNILKSKGNRIFINPRFINAGVTEHSRPATQLGRIFYFLQTILTTPLNTSRTLFSRFFSKK
jgi:hypothetical protein